MKKTLVVLFLMISSGLMAQSFSFDCSPSTPNVGWSVGAVGPFYFDETDPTPSAVTQNGVSYPLVITNPNALFVQGMSLVVTPPENVYYSSSMLSIDTTAVPENGRIDLPQHLFANNRDWADYTFIRQTPTGTSSSVTIWIEKNYN